MSVRFDGRAIALATGGVLVREAGDGPIGTDTRTMPAGSWFVALRGDRFEERKFDAKDR